MDAKEKPSFTPVDFAVMTYMKREFVFVPIEQNELTMLIAGYASIHFGLFGLCVGGVLTTLVTILVNTLPQNLRMGFLCASLILALASIYFGLMAQKDYKYARNLLKKIDESKIATITANPVP
jgi:hypothetical protein